MKIYKYIIFMFLVFGLITLAQAASISQTELYYIIKGQTNLPDERINQVIELLKKQVQPTEDGRFEIDGFLYGSGINFALLTDTDDWEFSVTVIDPVTRKPIRLKQMIEIEFMNGGIKAELAYKWMFTFLTSKISLDQLNGAVCGRGIGLVGEGGIGLEGSWMPCDRFTYGIVHIAIKAGFGAGIVFPKMQFKLKEIK